MKTDRSTSTILCSPSIKCSTSTAINLKRRLRSISRTRREVLVKRSEQVERLLHDLVAQLSESVSSIQGQFPTTANSNDSQERNWAGSGQNLTSYDSTDSIVGQILKENTGFHSDNLSPRSNSTVVRPYSTDLEILHSQLDFLNQELEGAQRLLTLSNSAEADHKAQLEVLRSQLLEARHDTIELRLQAAELLDKDNRTSTKSSPQANTVSLTWEEQKMQLLRNFELESEAIDFSLMTAGEFESLYVSTKRELADRDLQIAELKATLEIQSQVSSEGIAMGAASINHLLDTDSLIQEERERLRQLQDELQQKLRDAEIEISVERARVARDRLSLQNASLCFAEESQAAHDADAAKKDDQAQKGECTSPASERKLVPGSIPRTRKWLQRLGLRDDD